MSKLEHICLIVLSAAFAFLLGEGGLLLRDVRLHTVPRLTQAATDLDRSVIIIGGVATNIEKTSREWKTQQDQIAKRTLSTISSLNSDLTSANTLLVTGSSLLNSQTQSLNSLEQEASKSISDSASLIAALQPQLQQSLSSLTSASQSLAVTLADPAIQSMLANVNATSANVAGATDEIHGTTQDIHAFVHRETSPVTGTWNLIKHFLMEFAGPSAQIVTAAK